MSSEEWSSAVASCARRGSLTIASRSYSNFHEDKRKIQDSFTSVLSEYLKEEVGYEQQLHHLQVYFLIIYPFYSYF